jgi:heptosyltransferase-2
MIHYARSLRGRGFELAILLQNAFEAALIARLAGIPRTLGYGTDGRRFLLTHPCRISPEVRAHHQCYYYLGILAEAGWIRRSPWESSGYRDAATLAVSGRDLEAARGLLASLGVGSSEPLIGINPGAAYGSAKRWLPEGFAAAADRLASEVGATILIFGATADLVSARQVAAGMRHKPVLLAGLTTLRQLMALLKLCRLFLTDDSGPMHLAAALGVPQVAIFGSTDPVATGPLSTRARVIRRPVDCSPCFLRECPIDFRCMTGISVDEVCAAARDLW